MVGPGGERVYTCAVEGYILDCDLLLGLGGKNVVD